MGPLQSRKRPHPNSSKRDGYTVVDIPKRDDPPYFLMILLSFFNDIVTSKPVMMTNAHNHTSTPLPHSHSLSCTEHIHTLTRLSLINSFGGIRSSQNSHYYIMDEVWVSFLSTLYCCCCICFMHACQPFGVTHNTLTVKYADVQRGCRLSSQACPAGSLHLHTRHM